MNGFSQYFAGNDGNAMEIVNQSVSNFRNPADWLTDWATGGVRNDAGVTVNGYTALTHCPLWQGVNIIAGDLGQVPIRLVRNEFNEQKTHPTWQLTRVRPNALQTPNVFIETVLQWVLIWGNAVCWVIRQGSRPVELIPLRPDCLWPELVGDDAEPVVLYHYDSPILGRRFTFFPDDVVHIQGITSDGIWGYPLFQVAKNTIGQGLVLQKHGNKQFSNGSRPSGVLEHPMKLGEEARAQLRREWELIHGGANNSGKIAILWEGMKFNPTSMTNIDSQWIEAVKMSAIDAARLIGLPAYKLNCLEDSSSRANLEEQNETYKQMTLTRWANKIDQEFRRKLLTDREWKSDEYRFVFDWDAFMKADIDTLAQVADRLVKATIINPNEARRMIGKPPREGGDEYGNPSTSGPQPEDGKESPDNGRPRNQVENAHKELLLDRMMHFIERESISLRQAASGAKNFVKWLDEFYAQVDGQDPKIFALCDAVMGSSIRASCAAGLDARGITTAIAAYARKRHSQLLEACSDVTKEQLASTIEAMANDNATLIAQGLLATALGGINGIED